MNASNKTKIIILVAAVLVIAGRLGWLDPVADFFSWLTRPALSGARSAMLAVERTATNIFFIKDLYKENIELKERLKILETENAGLLVRLDEYKVLEQALNFKSQTGFELVGARIVSVDPASLRQTLLVDRGSSAGIVEGQAVVDSYGAYVGRVTRVLRNTAEITLVSDVQSRLPSRVVESGAQGIIQGQHGLAVALVEVPQGQDLPAGGRVVTGGFTPGVPAGLLIGRVENISSQDGDVFQKAIINLEADLRQLNIVFIITGTK